MPSKIVDVGRVPVYQNDGAVVFRSKMQLDADGAPNAYHPGTPEHPQTGRPPGLDYLGNAGGPGNWYGIVTDDGRRDGTPVVQGPSDPCPGFCVSSTSLEDPTQPPHSPNRYVDSTKVPFVVLPSRASRADLHGFSQECGVGLGDLAVVLYGGKLCAAIVADVGPAGKIGEGSIALAEALGLWTGDVNDAHDREDVTYVVFRGTKSSPAWPRSVVEFSSLAMAKFQEWGGLATVAAIYPSS